LEKFLPPISPIYGGNGSSKSFNLSSLYMLWDRNIPSSLPEEVVSLGKIPNSPFELLLHIEI